MGVKAVNVTNQANETLRLVLSDPYASGIAIKSIEGITPGAADVHVLEYAMGDGGLFGSSRAKTRTITFVLKPLDNPTVEHSRHRLYRFFPPKRQVTIDFETDLRNVSIVGWVQVNDTNIFSDDVETRIEVVCPQPYFSATHAMDNVISSLENVQSGFELPMDNAYGERRIEFSTVDSGEGIIVPYNGDAPTGITFELRVKRDFSNDITISKTGESAGITVAARKIEWQMKTRPAFKAGDKLRIYTHVGRKSAWLTRSNRTWHTSYAITGNTNWLQLEPGNNTFSYSGASNKDTELVMYANTLYYGV